jgi:hypothetical protein
MAYCRGSQMNLTKKTGKFSDFNDFFSKNRDALKKRPIENFSGQFFGKQDDPGKSGTVASSVDYKF